MAEAIFQHMLEEKGLTNSIMCDSAGTGAYHIGNAPDPRTLEVLEKNDISTDQKARQLEINDFETFDYILVMDKQNLSNAKALQSKATPHAKAKLDLVLHYASELNKDEVPDPYYGGMRGFDDVYDMLNVALHNFLSEVN